MQTVPTGLKTQVWMSATSAKNFKQHIEMMHPKNLRKCLEVADDHKKSLTKG